MKHLVLRHFIFIFLTYLLLGCVTCAVTFDMRAGAYSSAFKPVMVLLGIHIVFIALGGLLAVKSQPEGKGYRNVLSPGAWGAALVISYLIGFIGFWLAK